MDDNKELIQLRIDTVRLQEKLQASEESLKIAREAMERRLDGMNEFRDTLRDQASRFITYKEVESKFDALEKNRKDNTAFIISMISALVSTSSLVISLMIR